MKTRCFPHMRTCAAVLALAALLVLGAASAGAQAPNAKLEERLAAMERRIEQLEQENRELKGQVAGLTGQPQPQVRTLGMVAGPASAAVGSVAEPTQPQALKAPPQAAEKPAPPKQERFEIGGQVRFRPQLRQNLDFNGQKPDLVNEVQQRTRFHIRTRVSDTVEAYVEVQDFRVWGLESSPTSNDNLTDLHQGYVLVKDLFTPGTQLKVGRQEMEYGTGRQIGVSNFTSVGRTFDSMKFGYYDKKLGSEFFAAKVVDRRESGDTLAAGRVGSGTRDQYLYSLYNSFFKNRPHHLEVYGIFFRDGLRTAGEIPKLGGKAPAIWTLGFHNDGRLNPGITYDWEFAQQWGNGGMVGNTVGGFDPHNARAFAGRLYKTVNEDHAVRFGFEYDMATGDKDPTDGKSGEYFQLLPSAHAKFGIADLIGWQNMKDFRPTFMVAPWKTGRFQADWHRLYLMDAKGPWRDTKRNVFAQDPKGLSGTHIGDEVDFVLSFPLHKNLRVEPGYAIFFPGEFARKTKGKDNQTYLYLMTTIDF